MSLTPGMPEYFYRNNIPSSIPEKFRHVMEVEGAKARAVGDQHTGLPGQGYMIDFPGDLDLTKYDLAYEDLPAHVVVNGNLTIDADDFYTIAYGKAFHFRDLILKGKWRHAQGPDSDQLTGEVERGAAVIAGRVKLLLDQK